MFLCTELYIDTLASSNKISIICQCHRGGGLLRIHHCTTSPLYDSSPVTDELRFSVPHSRKTFLGKSVRNSCRLMATDVPGMPDRWRRKPFVLELF